MSTVERKTACVTGGNGYIASALIKMLLDKGYAVNTTVRNPELVEAGVRGTLNVMRSCVNASTVRRVVLTSSAAAVFSRPLEGDGHVLDESSWSDVEYLRSGANRASPGKAYSLSKVLSEKEASKMAEENGISLVAVCPVITVGPAPEMEAKPCVAAVFSLLSGDEKMISTVKLMEMDSGGLMLVHVGDVCRAEIFLAEKASASGRYICSCLNTTVLQLSRSLAAKYPHYNVNIAALGGDVPEKPRICLSSEKLTREGFEFRYKTLDEMYNDGFFGIRQSPWDSALLTMMSPCFQLAITTKDANLGGSRAKAKKKQQKRSGKQFRGRKRVEMRDLISYLLPFYSCGLLAKILTPSAMVFVYQI